jgi:hypothetical protein
MEHLFEISAEKRQKKKAAATAFHQALIEFYNKKRRE